MDATESAAQVVSCDAGPLIHLDELGCLDLLADFQAVWVAPAVVEEVKLHRPSALRDPGIPFSQTQLAAPLTQAVTEVGRLFALHRGELEALHLAIQIDADLFLTDDTAARLAANNLAIPVHGTIGILLRSIRRGQRSPSEVLVVLRSLPSISTLHLKSSLLEEIIARVEKIE